MIAHDIARCIGHGCGPTGHQLRADCVNCARRTAPRPAGQFRQMEPPAEYPCPSRIPAEKEETAKAATGVTVAPAKQCKHLSECIDQQACYGPTPGCRRALGMPSAFNDQGEKR